MLKFGAFMFKNRERWSAAERKGLGRSAFLSAAYHLPKYIFVELAYDGWVGLDAVAPAERRRGARHLRQDVSG